MNGLHEAFDEIVADVPVYGDLDRAIEQADRERRHRNGVVAGLAAAAAVVALIVGVLAITRDGNNLQQPIGPPTPTSAPTSTPTERTPAAAEWPGPIRPGTWPVLPPKQAKSWADPPDAVILGIDIRKVTTDWTNAGWWGFRLAAAPPRPQSLDPAQRIFEYGIVVDADGDQEADCQVGLNNDAAQRGDYRVWVTNLRTTETDERVGPPYGFPIEFRTPNGFAERPQGIFTFLQDPQAPCGRFGPAATFYLWASLTKAGKVTAWDYAPDEAWLPMPCDAQCREWERHGN